jgi:hypothetical protein
MSQLYSDQEIFIGFETFMHVDRACRNVGAVNISIYFRWDMKE